MMLSRAAILGREGPEGVGAGAAPSQLPSQAGRFVKQD